MTQPALQHLEPTIVWQHFAMLCHIPRASLQESTLRNYLLDWAKARNLATQVDQVGNLIIRKPASAGYEKAATVVLQGHLDMVCQVNNGTQHDFSRDSIQTKIQDGWVIAENTTLGADNGIGVALALAALEANDIEHPALEVLLTVNEEAGMDGARGLRPNTLKGKYLINMDSEEWGYFYLGCAGGIDVKVQHQCKLLPFPEDYKTWRLTVSGLHGGHSGIDIHLNRGNAIKLLAEALSAICDENMLHLISLQGGNARNAIPREASAIFAMSGDVVPYVSRILADWRKYFAESDPNVQLNCEPVPCNRTQAVYAHEQAMILGFLQEVPNGVTATSPDFPNVTDTSTNLGVIKLEHGSLHATFKVRSLHDKRASELAAALQQQARWYGFKSIQSGGYPGWTPNPNSPLLALCQQAYQAEFGQTAGLQVIHAGLECGLLAASHPHLQMISFGPDIRGAHAPGERVEIASVANCWQLLKGILRGIKQ